MIKKIFYIVFPVLIIVLTAGIVFISSYLNDVKFYEPVKISLSGENKVKADHFQPFGITPKGRIFLFYTRNSITYYNGYSFFSQIAVLAEKHIISESKNIKITIGKKNFNYSSGSIEKNWKIVQRGFTGEESSIIIVLPESLYTKDSKIEMGLSVFHWSIVQKLLFVMSCLVLMIFVIFKFRLIFNVISYIIKNISKISKQTEVRILINAANSIAKGIEKRITNWSLLIYHYSCIMLNRLKTGLEKIKSVIFKKWFISIIINSLLIVSCIVLWYVFFVLIKEEYYYFKTGLLFLAVLCLSFFMLAKIILHFLKSLTSLKQNIYLLVFAIFIALAGMEVLFRFGIKKHESYHERNGLEYVSLYKDYTKSWFFLHAKRHLLKTIYSEYVFESYTNNEGLSDIDFCIAKDTNEYRILTLGDSFTEGFGAARDSTWPRLLVENIESYNSNKRIHIMNAGVGGSDVCYEYMLLKYRLLKYKPDHVIIALNNSDISDLTVRGGMERFNTDTTTTYRKVPAWEWLYAISFTFRHIIHDVCRYDYLFINSSQHIKERTLAIKKIISTLCLFKPLAEEHHFELLVIVHPMNDEIACNRFYFGTFIEKACKQANISTFNLFDYYTKILHIDKNNVNNYYWKIDTHHNAKGYGAFAKGVAWKLEQMGVISRQSLVVSR